MSERCPYCRGKMRRCMPIPYRHAQPYDMTRQHIIPVRRGGTDRRENIRMCCYACNQALALVDDCPGALACAVALGEALGFGKGHGAARGAIRRAKRGNGPWRDIEILVSRPTLADVWPA